MDPAITGWKLIRNQKSSDMAITVYYLGILADTTGRSVEEIKKTEAKSGVLEYILEKYPEFRKLSFVVSHNGSITHEDPEIKEGDRITLIPPAPGG